MLDVVGLSVLCEWNMVLFILYHVTHMKLPLGFVLRTGNSLNCPEAACLRRLLLRIIVYDELELVVGIFAVKLRLREGCLAANPSR